MTDYSPLSLAQMRDGHKHGAFTFEGVTIRVKVEHHAGTYRVLAASEHRNLTPVFGQVGTLLKVKPGRFALYRTGSENGYEDSGTVASLAERLVRYAAETRVV